MRCLAVKVEGAGNDSVGVSGNHVDTGDLLGGLNEESKENTTECLSLATFEKFSVVEWGSSLLRLERGLDRFQVLDNVRVVHGLVCETRENVMCFVHAAFLDEPAR